jgi:hypothetical protein
MTPYPPKSAIIAILIWYLLQHWFNYFFPPWSLGDIFTGRHVPFPLAIGLCASATAWAWKFQEPVVFVKKCLVALLFHLVQRDAFKWPFFVNSVLVCGYHVLLMISGVRREKKLEMEQSCDAAKSRVREDEDVEAARDEKGAEAPDASFQASKGRFHAGSRSTTQTLAKRLPSKNTALLAALLATAATMTFHAPELVSQYLSTINCSAHITALDPSNQHFSFTTSDKPGRFARPCAGDQQIYTLVKPILAHVNASSATCGVWCLRWTEEGELVGFVSQVGYGLVDMYYCRGMYQAFGPDCEAEGEEYGYDVGREGWMSEVFEPWNLIAQSEAEGMD